MTTSKVTSFSFSILLIAIMMMALGVVGSSSSSSPSDAPEWRYYTPSKCGDAGGTYEKLDKGSDESTAAAAQEHICVLEFETVCGGTTICNNIDEVCRKVVRSDNTTDNICIAQGAILTPDTGAFLIFQVIVAGLGLSLCYGVGVVPYVVHLSSLKWNIVVVGIMTVIGVPLYLTYYYLNAYVLLAAAFGSMLFFGQRFDGGIALTVGMGMCVCALMFVVHDSGLGLVQHHSRFDAGPSTNDTYEIMCSRYYRGYFAFPLALHEGGDNPQVLFRTLCSRAWLATALGLLVTMQVLLIVHMGLGVRAFFADHPRWRSERKRIQARSRQQRCRQQSLFVSSDLLATPHNKNSPRNKGNYISNNGFELSPGLPPKRATFADVVAVGPGNTSPSIASAVSDGEESRATTPLHRSSLRPQSVILQRQQSHEPIITYIQEGAHSDNYNNNTDDGEVEVELRDIGAQHTVAFDMDNITVMHNNDNDDTSRTEPIQ